MVNTFVLYINYDAFVIAISMRFIISVFMCCFCIPAFPLENDSIDRVIDLRDSIYYGYVESDTLHTVDIIVIHSDYCVTDTFSFEGCLKQFEQYNVCSHYMIDRDANIYYLVGENDIAWHAGKSNLPETDKKMLNKSSIGIESYLNSD